MYLIQVILVLFIFMSVMTYLFIIIVIHYFVVYMYKLQIAWGNEVSDSLYLTVLLLLTSPRDIMQPPVNQPVTINILCLEKKWICTVL